MAYETMLVEKKGTTVTVIFNRPNKLNAINDQVREEFVRLFDELRQDTDTRFVIFTGAGNAFSSGADIGDASQSFVGPEAAQRSRMGQMIGHDIIRKLESLEQVTIAAVNGIALGAGLVIVMGCDFRIASANAKFGIPETNVGIFFTWGSTPRLVSLIGPTKAKEMIMTCDMIDAEEAHRIGLVNKVVPPEQLMPAVQEIIDKVGSKGPLATRITKKLVNAAAAPNIGDVYVVEPELVERLYLSGDPAEGRKAFQEKRPPKFPGV